MEAPSTRIVLDVTTASSSYPVVIGRGTSMDVSSLLAEVRVGSERLAISNRRVWRLHGHRLRSVLGRNTPPALIGDGEKAKTLATAATLYKRCAERRLGRSASIIALGGGVVGDVAGFVAATYLRGLRIVQIPTTLLAQVDSSVGGKTGVNLPSGKNLVGSFHAPVLVVCDPDVLTTLPRREFRAGLYEVVKYGVIASRSLFDRVSHQLSPILDCDGALLTTLVAECCRIKARVVMSDERESGERRILNFGHTVGHALEAVTNYRRFLHGEAIGYGMLAAAAVSRARGLMTADEESALRTLVDRVGRLPPVSDLRIGPALDVIGRDKKVVEGRLHFVLARGIGGTEIVADVHPKELRAAMTSIGMRT